MFYLWESYQGYQVSKLVNKVRFAPLGEINFVLFDKIT